MNEFGNAVYREERRGEIAVCGIIFFIPLLFLFSS
jgi:hypothetical protein